MCGNGTSTPGTVRKPHSVECEAQRAMTASKANKPQANACLAAGEVPTGGGVLQASIGAEEPTGGSHIGKEDACKVNAWRNGIITVEILLLGRDVSGHRKGELRWPVGPHAEERLGWSDFCRMALGVYGLSCEVLRQTESRFNWTVRQTAPTSGFRTQWTRMCNSQELWRAVSTAQSLQGTLRVTAELRRRSRTESLPRPTSHVQLALRRKLEQRRATKTTMVPTVSHEVWSRLNPKSQHWLSWKHSVRHLLAQTQLVDGAGVTHIIPPRSRRHNDAYMLTPIVRSIYFNTFTALERRFAFVAATQADNDAMLHQVLQNASGIQISHQAAGCITDPFSFLALAQDMTILVSREIEPVEFVAARRTTKIGRPESMQTLIEGMRDATSESFDNNFIPAYALQVAEFLGQETKEEAAARAIQDEIIIAETMMQQSPTQGASRKKTKKKKGAKKKTQSKTECVRAVDQQITDILEPLPECSSVAPNSAVPCERQSVIRDEIQEISIEVGEDEASQGLQQTPRLHALHVDPDDVTQVEPDEIVDRSWTVVQSRTRKKARAQKKHMQRRQTTVEKSKYTGTGQQIESPVASSDTALPSDETLSCELDVSCPTQVLAEDAVKLKESPMDEESVALLHDAACTPGSSLTSQHADSTGKLESEILEQICVQVEDLFSSSNVYSDVNFMDCMDELCSISADALARFSCIQVLAKLLQPCSAVGAVLKACNLSTKLVQSVATRVQVTGEVVIDYRISPVDKLDCQRALYNHIRAGCDAAAR